MKKSPPKRPKAPINRPVFWLSFVGGLIFFGAVLGLIAVQFVDILGTVLCMGLWAGFTVGISAYVARVGYDALRNMLTSFMP